MLKNSQKSFIFKWIAVDGDAAMPSWRSGGLRASPLRQK
jgi:hypothetical protein